MVVKKISNKGNQNSKPQAQNPIPTPNPKPQPPTPKFKVRLSSQVNLLYVNLCGL